MSFSGGMSLCAWGEGRGIAFSKLLSCITLLPGWYNSYLQLDSVLHSPKLLKYWYSFFYTISTAT